MSLKQLGIDVLIAVGLSIVESLNVMSVLSGTLYALIKGSDVVWSMLLSWCVLGKQYSRTQVPGVAVVLLGIAAVFGLGAPLSTASSRHQQATLAAMQSGAHSQYRRGGCFVPNGSLL